MGLGNEWVGAGESSENSLVMNQVIVTPGRTWVDDGSDGLWAMWSFGNRAYLNALNSRGGHPGSMGAGPSGGGGGSNSSSSSSSITNFPAKSREYGGTLMVELGKYNPLQIGVANLYELVTGKSYYTGENTFRSIAFANLVTLGAAAEGSALARSAMEMLAAEPAVATEITVMEVPEVIVAESPAVVEGEVQSLIRTTSYSIHSLERLAQRGVTESMVDIAISKGQKFYDPLNNSINYVLPNAFASGKA